jgi:signal transduction histidine kinase
MASSQKSQEKNITYTVYASMGLMLFFSAINISSNMNPIPSLTGLAIYGILAILNVYRQYVITKFIFCLSSIAAMIDAIFNFGGAFSTAYLLSPTLTIYFFVLYKPKTALIWTFCYVITLFTAGIVFTVYDLNDMSKIPHDQRILFTLISSLFANLMIGFGLWYSISQRNKAFAKVQKSKEAVEDLLRVIVHDICNPMLVINLAGPQILKELEKIEDEPTSKKFSNIHMAASRLTRASLNLTNILDSVSILHAADTQSLPMEAIDGSEIRLFIEDFFESRMKIKNISLSQNIDQSLSFKCHKSSFLNSVLSNLLSNAIKFTREGGTIQISLERENDRAVLTVKDNGIGMPPKLKESIFIRNSTASRKGTSGEKGTGFGLPILKKYLDIYDAKIKVDSIEEEVDPKNSGTTFTLGFHLVN